MLCHACRVHVRRDFPYCLHCGTPRRNARIGAFTAPLLRRGEEEYPLVKPETTIGRDPDNDLVVDHPSVSRHHARIVRAADGFHVRDLGSFNGTTRTGGDLSAPLPDNSELFVGDVALRFEQPRPIAVGGRTFLHGTEHTLLPGAEETAPTATERLSARPRRHGGWALKRVPDSRGQLAWVLRSTRTGRYLQLDDRDVFLWELLDGRTTIQDLLFAYAEAYAELALPRIEGTLRTLAEQGFVSGLHGTEPEAGAAPVRLLRRLARVEVSIGGLDALVGRWYQKAGWLLFTPLGVAALWLLVAGGLAGFRVAAGRQRLGEVGGAGGWAVAVIGIGYLAALLAHEAAHALAVKSYGRTVTRAGFLVLFGLPFAFVDTSDMWFGSRWSRLVVTLAGPLSTAGIAGGLALGAAYLTDPVASGICFQLSFGLYLNTLYNLNPLLPLDGYQAFSDLLRLPRLREESLAYLSGGMWRDLRARRRPGLRELGLTGYGLAAVAGTAGFVLMALLAWRDRLDRLLPPPVGATLAAAVIILALLPAGLRLGRRLAARLCPSPTDGAVR